MDGKKTAAAFIIVYIIIAGGTAMSPMKTSTVAMVAGALAVYGVISLYIGVKHGEYREEVRR